MNVVYVIFSCIFAAEAVRSSPRNHVEVLLDFYNNKLNVFDLVLLPNLVDDWQKTSHIPFDTIMTLRDAWIPYTSLMGVFTSYCIEATKSVPFEPIGDSNFVQSAYKELKAMKKHFDSIPTNDNLTKDEFADIVKKIIVSNRHPEPHDKLLTPIKHLDSVPTNENFTNDQFVDGVEELEVTNGLLKPHNMSLPALQQNITENIENNSSIFEVVFPFYENASHAKRIIKETLNALKNAKEGNSKYYIVTKCRTVLNRKKSTPP